MTEYRINVLGSRRYAVNYKGVLVGSVHKGDRRDGESKNRWYVDGQKTKYKRREHAIAFLIDQYLQSQKQVEDPEEYVPEQIRGCAPDVHSDLKREMGKCAGALMVWTDYAPRAKKEVRRNLRRCRRHAKEISEHYMLHFGFTPPFAPVR
jgi:hypothetical protein